MEPSFLCQAIAPKDPGESTTVVKAPRRSLANWKRRKWTLHGRTNEIAALQDCWKNLMATTALSSQADDETKIVVDSVKANSANRRLFTVHVVVVRGPLGVGKRSLVQSTFLPLSSHHPSPATEGSDKNGTLVYTSGRFRSTAPKIDTAETSTGTAWNKSHQKRHSLDAIVEALEQFASDTVMDQALRRTIREHIVARSDLDSNPLAQALLLLLDDSGITDKMPARRDQLLSNIMNSTSRTARCAGLPCNPTSGSTENRTHLVQLVRAIASCVPLVLHLEQCHCADPEAVAFFDLLLEQNDPNSGKANTACKGLLIVLSYEDNEDSDEDSDDDSNDGANSEAPIESFFSRLRQQDRDAVTTIRLTDLSYDDVKQWTLDVVELQSPSLSNDTRAVTKYLFESTRGNPLLLRYIWQYISLELSCQPPASIIPAWENAPFWSEIRRNVDSWVRGWGGSISSSAELYVQIVQRQTSAILELIETMALMGECGAEDSVDPSLLEVVLRVPCAEAIEMACDQGLLEATFTGRLRFPRPELQLAAASGLVAPDDRTSRHLRIGRRIWKQSGLDSCDDTLDDASPLLYVVARSLQLGIRHANDINELDVIAVIHLRSGKKAMRSSEFAAAASYFEFALFVLGDRQWNAQRAKSFQDKLVAHTTLVYTNCARNRVDEALVTAFTVLRELGEAIPDNPSDRTIAMEYAKTRWILRRKSDRDFLSFPKASNEAKIAAMQMLNFIILYAYVINPNLGVLAILRIVQLAVKYGIAGPAIQAIGAYGFLLSARRGRQNEGVRFGQIALALLEQQRDAVAWLPRTYFYTHGLTFRWKFPIRENLKPLHEGHQTALQTGDLESATFTAHVAVGLSFHAGTPLEQLEHEIRSYCHNMEPLGQVFALLSLIPRWSFVCNLIGDSKPPLDLSGDIQDAESALKRAVADNRKTALGLYYLYCGFYSCLNGAYLDASAMIDKSMTFLVDSDVWIVFYKGLPALSAAWDDTRKARSQFFSIGRKAIRQTKKCASVCPANFMNKYTLLQAEWAAHRGATSKALSYYAKSISLANQAGFTQEEALAYERAAHYHSRLGNIAFTRSLLESALVAYERWGAQSLVRRVEDELQRISE